MRERQSRSGRPREREAEENERKGKKEEKERNLKKASRVPGPSSDLSVSYKTGKFC